MAAGLLCRVAAALCGRIRSRGRATCLPSCAACPGSAGGAAGRPSSRSGREGTRTDSRRRCASGERRRRGRTRRPPGAGYRVAARAVARSGPMPAAGRLRSRAASPPSPVVSVPRRRRDGCTCRRGRRDSLPGSEAGHDGLIHHDLDLIPRELGEGKTHRHLLPGVEGSVLDAGG